MTARYQWYDSLTGTMMNFFSKMLAFFVQRLTASYAGQGISVVVDFLHVRTSSVLLTLLVSPSTLSRRTS
jgi:hypothetical protein